MTKTVYDALMQDVCIGWGYCDCLKHGQALHVDLIIPPDGPVTADQFVEWVLLAENPNPSLRPNSRRRSIRAAFVTQMGGEVVDAETLQWSETERAAEGNPGQVKPS